MNIIQIFERFPTQESRVAHLEATRWRGGKPRKGTKGDGPDGHKRTLQTRHDTNFRRSLPPAFPKHDEQIPLAPGDDE